MNAPSAAQDQNTLNTLKDVEGDIISMLCGHDGPEPYADKLLHCSGDEAQMAAPETHDGEAESVNDYGLLAGGAEVGGGQIKVYMGYESQCVQACALPLCLYLCPGSRSLLLAPLVYLSAYHAIYAFLGCTGILSTPTCCCGGGPFWSRRCGCAGYRCALVLSAQGVCGSDSSSCRGRSGSI